MDQNGRARILAAGNAIIKPELARHRNVPTRPQARHVVRVQVNEKTASAGYRYNDDFEIGVSIDTNTLIGFFAK